MQRYNFFLSRQKIPAKIVILHENKPTYMKMETEFYTILERAVSKAMNGENGDIEELLALAAEIEAAPGREESHRGLSRNHSATPWRPALSSTDARDDARRTANGAPSRRPTQPDAMNICL